MSDQSEHLTNVFSEASAGFRQRGIRADDIVAALLNAAVGEAIRTDGPEFAARLLRHAAMELEQRMRKAGEMN